MKEITGEQKWPHDGYDPNTSYNDTFEPVLGPYKTLETFAAAKKAAGEKTRTFDLGGSAAFADDPEPFDSLTGFRTTPLPSEFAAGPSGASPNREEFLGNAYSPKDWKRLDDHMDSRGIAAFDIILIRPIGGTFELRSAAGEIGRKAIPQMNAIFNRVLQRAWERLSPGGDMFIEIPASIESQPEYARWLDRVRESGADVLPKPGVLRLHKPSENPLPLPQ
jgi:hypothetical protein